MKNKIAAYAVIIVLFTVPVSHAMRWGTEFTGSLWKMDGKEFQATVKEAKNFAPATVTQVTQNKLGGSAGIFIEGDAPVCLGVSVGYGLMPTSSFKLRLMEYIGDENLRLSNETTYIPLDLYVKYKAKTKKVSFFAGGGVDYVMARTDYRWDHDAVGQKTWATFSQKKVIPHVQAGGEWFVTKWLSLNAGMKYFFSAVLDNLTGNVTDNGTPQGKYRLTMIDSSYGEQVSFSETSGPLPAGERPFKYDLSGLRANIALRVHFK